MFGSRTFQFGTLYWHEPAKHMFERYVHDQVQLFEPSEWFKVNSQGAWHVDMALLLWLLEQFWPLPDDLSSLAINNMMPFYGVSNREIHQ